MTIALSRRTKTFLLAATGLVALFLVLIASFPLGWLRAPAERQLAQKFGSGVTIGTLEREDHFSLHPVIRLADIRVAQQPWAGAGEMATIGALRLRVALLPLLWGHFGSEVLSAQHVRLNLVRAADGRENWRKDKARKAGGTASDLAVVSVEDMVLRYSDAKQKRVAVLTIRVDPTNGLLVSGTGSVDGAPVRLSAKAPPMVDGKPWPFEGIIEGPLLAIHAKGSMAGPLRTDDMQFHVTARADDLKRIDRVIEAGLFGTQPVSIEGDARHADRTWTIDKLTGTVGRSALTGRLSAGLDDDGRTKLNGDLHFARLDFDDLASDQGQAKAEALEDAQGPKLVPNTRINIRKIWHTDGRIAIRADQVLSGRRPSSITSASGVLNMDHRVLTIDPLRIGLKQGAISGRAVVDQRDGGPHPRVTMALDLVDSRIPALAGGGNGDIQGRVDARVRLTGMGDTIRDAVGTSNGSIGLAARAGALPRSIAALMGFDIGKTLVGDDKGQATLRCAVIRLAVRNGRGTIDPMVADTSISQTVGQGTISFPSEALAVTLNGRPKSDAALRLPGPVQLSGTIRDPHIELPKGSSALGTFFKAIGRALSGDNSPPATDADCGALIRRALG